MGVVLTRDPCGMSVIGRGTARLSTSMTWANGEWEHAHGVTIESFDNPDGGVEAVSGTSGGVERSEADWLLWRVADGRFEAACRACNPGEAVAAFLALHR